MKNLNGKKNTNVIILSYSTEIINWKYLKAKTKKKERKKY